jgi:hypothetical protein
MSTYTLISSQVLGSSAASVTFSSIPQTYKDLVLRISARNDYASVAFDNLYVTFNGEVYSGSQTTYSDTFVRGNGSATASGFDSAASKATLYQALNSATATSNTFSNNEMYIPNYTSSAYKPISSFNTAETNATNAYINAEALLWSNTSAITSITLSQRAGPNFVSGSSFYLYGV